MTWTFKEIIESMIQKLKSYDSWLLDILTFGVYSQIIDMISFILEKLVYSLDFWYIETTENAQLTQSVISQAKGKGYIPPRKTGASGYLTIGTDSTFATESLIYSGRDVPIYKWDSFTDENSETFVYATEDKIFYSGSNQRNKTIAATQSALEISSGVVGIPVLNHGLVSGEIIKINKTKNYDGVFAVLSSSTVNRVHISANYIAETFIGDEELNVGYLFLPVKEGVVRTYNYIALGEVEEEIKIYSADIDNEEIQVDIVDTDGNVLYNSTKVDDLYFAPDTTNYYHEINNFNDYTGVSIKFGDGITAKLLSAGTRVKVTWADTKGADGNIGAAGLISKSVFPIVDVLNQETTVYIKNETSINGGTNLLSLDKIKKIANSQYNAGFQLNNRDSWVNAIEDVSYIDRAKVWTELDLSNGLIQVANTANQNFYYVTALTTEGEQLSNARETDISVNYLIPKKSPTDTIVWKKIKKVLIKFNVVAAIRNVMSIADAETEISDELQLNYDVLKLDFAEEINNSNYRSTIDNIKPLVIRNSTTASYVDPDMPFQVLLQETQVRKPASVEVDATKQILLYSESVELWLRRKVDSVWYDPYQIAETVSVSFNGVNTYSVAGNVDYANSKVTYQVNDIISDIVPSVTGNATTFNSSNTVTMTDTSMAQVGMYVQGGNIDSDTTVLEVNLNTSIILSKPTLSTGAGANVLTFCMSPDPGASFGIRDPNESDMTGYLIYLVYKTVDGNGSRLEDLRLSNFDEIFDYSAELSTFNLTYEG